jgi:hypothetical protein
MTKRPKRPTDIVQRGKLIGDLLTGQVEEAPTKPVSAAAELGSKGGKARAATLSKEDRKAIASNAAQKRWRSR